MIGARDPSIAGGAPQAPPAAADAVSWAPSSPDFESPPLTARYVAVRGSAAAAAARLWEAVQGQEVSSFLVSCIFHLLLLIVLALWGQIAGGDRRGLELTAGSRVVDAEELFGQTDPDLVVREPLTDADAAPRFNAIEPLDVVGPSAMERMTRPPSESLRIPADPTERMEWLRGQAARGGDTPVQGLLAGRSPEARSRLAAQRGATRESEAAVERGLRWLAAHQLDHGGWDFDHRKGLCGGQCRNPGTEATTTGATGLALLPFLGAGYTQQEGEYREVVARGLYYLSTRMRMTPHGGDLQEGTMYGQGIAAIALCEAYAMTGDPNLRPLAQYALDFVVYAQDRSGGGWRYSPGEPGDITVTGWQLMALKSGQMALLDVPQPSIYLAQRFLDGVQTDGGAGYGYMTPQAAPTTTSIGLLCRMYTGWDRSHPGLAAGIEYLAREGPSPDDMYFNYYATQALAHWGGPKWEVWNEEMREHLVATQARVGHEAGSWFFDCENARSAGRLYDTAMAVMILEVYYRYMPLYTERAARP